MLPYSRKGQDMLSWTFPSKQSQKSKLFCDYFGGKDRIGYPSPFLQISPRRINSSGSNLAERTGFEPAKELPLYTLSKRAP